MLGSILKSDRQTPSIETREHYNVKARGLTFVTAPKAWSVDADTLIRDRAQNDDILYDVVRKKSWTHNKYYPRHQSKVNKNWRLWKIDLDREQYNHMRIPVTHSINVMAPTFDRRFDKEQHSCLNSNKFLNENQEQMNCRSQATIKDMRHTPLEVAIPELKQVKYINSRASVKQKRLQPHSQTNLKMKKVKYINMQNSIKGKNRIGDRCGTKVKLLDKSEVHVSLNPKGTKIYDTNYDFNPIRQDIIEMNVQSNLVSHSKKIETHFNNTNDNVRDEILQTSIGASRGKNLNEGYHPAHTLSKTIKEGMSDYDIGHVIPQFEKQSLDLKSYLRD